jgi:hypothetical protein
MHWLKIELGGEFDDFLGGHLPGAELYGRPFDQILESPLLFSHLACYSFGPLASDAPEIAIRDRADAQVKR